MAKSAIFTVPPQTCPRRFKGFFLFYLLLTQDQTPPSYSVQALKKKNDFLDKDAAKCCYPAASSTRTNAGSRIWSTLQGPKKAWAQRGSADLVDEDVVGLEVPMEDALVVHVRQRRAELPERWLQHLGGYRSLFQCLGRLRSVPGETLKKPTAPDCRLPTGRRGSLF